jgi:GDP-4-dehydro-6-deoxy-D-mannose reductase
LKKILILGSEGFTGKYFFDFLKINDIKSENYLVDKIPENLIKRENYYEIDLLKKREIYNFLRDLKPELIFNFIGLMFSNNLHKLININVITAENLLSSINDIKNYDPEVLLIGSAAEYGFVDYSDLPINETCKKKPINNYGLSKVFLDKLAEKHIQNSNIRIYRAKPFNFIGPGLSEKLIIGTISLQIEKIRKGLQPNNLYVGNLEARRDFVDIRDVVSAYWRIINSNCAGEVFNIGSGKPTKVKSIVKNFIKLLGLNVKIVQRRNLVKKIDPPDIYSDITKIRKSLRWKPEITLEQSIKDILSSEYLNYC